MAINEKYSYGYWGGLGPSFLTRPAAEFNDSTIVGSCFYRILNVGDAIGKRQIFPDGMTGVIFDHCNMDNIVVPVGNTVLPNCCHRTIIPQNDLCDWIADDDTLAPVEPIDKAEFIELGLSIRPEDIPADVGNRNEPLTKTTRRELN